MSNYAYKICLCFFELQLLQANWTLDNTGVFSFSALLNLLKSSFIGIIIEIYTFEHNTSIDASRKNWLCKNI